MCNMKVLVTQLCLALCNAWTKALQASLSLEFSRQKYQSGLLFPSPGDLPDPGTEPGSPAFQTDSLPSEQPGKQSGKITRERKPRGKISVCVC